MQINRTDLKLHSHYQFFSGRERERECCFFKKSIHWDWIFKVHYIIMSFPSFSQDSMSPETISGLNATLEEIDKRAAGKRKVNSIPLEEAKRDVMILIIIIIKVSIIQKIKEEEYLMIQF